MQAIHVMRICRKSLLAAKLRVAMPAGLHVLHAEFMEDARRNSDGPLGSLPGLSGCSCPAFMTVHIGAVRLEDDTL
jgi:hypothetical protein